LVIGKSSSGVGGSSRVIIRGNKSISGENQPLYVIDGIPINNSNFGQIGGSQLAGTVDGGDAISNINPDDIESINVLKGAAASALYGSMGQNGVILITTKKGKVGTTSVEVSSSTSFDCPVLLPELQGTYGATTPVDPKSLQNDPSTWGAKDNGAITTSDLRDFFQTGLSTINSVAITTGNDKNLIYASYANTSSNGIVAKNALNKNNFYVKGDSKLSDKISFEGSANFISQNVKDRPYVGFYNNPVGEAYLYPGSSADFKGLKNNFQEWNPTRSLYVQKYPYSAYNSGSYLLDNPYWTINKNPNSLKRSRSIFTGEMKWNITKDLNVRARTSYDRIDDQFEQDVYASSSSVNFDEAGAYTLQKNTTSQIYSDAFLSYNKEKINDFSINAALGASNNYSYGYNLLGQSVLGQNNFVGVNVFSLTNLKGTFTHTENTTETLNQSIFGTATVGFKEMFFVDVTGRNEWASTISNESFFYPSVGGTFVLSELTGKNDLLSFAKIRGTYSEVGNALPYGVNNGQNSQYWTVVNGILTNPQNGVPLLANGSPIELKPERSKSMELGANVRLFNNSIDLDVTYYNNKIQNQYFPVTAPLGAYVPNFYVNAGEVQNKGVEISLTYRYAPTGGLKYSTTFNFAYNKNEILSVNDEANLKSYTLTQYANTKIGEIHMVKGGSFGDIYAYDFARDASGKVLIDTSAAKKGQPIATSDFVKVGNPNSPVQLGWSNTFSFKGVSFNFLIDGKFGGEVISFTESMLDANGRSKRSADALNAGKVDFEGQTVATGHDAVVAWYKGLSGIGSNYVYKATNIRIREISLGYDIPVQFANGAIKNLNLSLFGKNVLFLYNKAPFDPEVSAGSSTGLQGFEALSMPSTRTFGFSLKATF
jgi:TonB-linked SusC/RagA family outer membrane protein